MKIFIIVSISCLVFIGGCKSTSDLRLKPDSRPGAQLRYPNEYMFICSSGKKAAFSALELELIAKSYIKNNKIPYDIAGTEMTIWINTDGGNKIADVYFHKGINDKSLKISIDKDGQVISYEIYISMG